MFSKKSKIIRHNNPGRDAEKDKKEDKFFAQTTNHI